MVDHWLAVGRLPAYAHAMALMPSLNPRIVEALYTEALCLADNVRARFERLRQSIGTQTSIEASTGARIGKSIATGTGTSIGDGEDLHRVQISCEALRTTTRVMHCLAWLLNHRAYFAGELSELQLRRHGRLIANFPASEDDIVATLPKEVRELVIESERLYQRIQRLEQSWRTTGLSDDSAVRRLRERLSQAVGDAA